MNLFELNKEFRESIKRVEFFAMENDGEINENLEAEFKALELAREEKALNVAGYIKEIDAEADMIKEQEKKLAERRKGLENKSDRLTAYLRSSLTEGEKLSSPWAQISWRKSKSVEIIDEKSIDKKYIEMVPKILKSSISDDLKAGLKVEGAVLIEKINLQIK